MIERLNLPDRLEGEPVEGQETGSLVRLPNGNLLSIVAVHDTTPPTWGIMLCDMLRQAAIAFEANGLTLDGRTLTRTEIEAAIKRTLDNEFGSPTSDIEQRNPGAGGN